MILIIGEHDKEKKTVEELLSTLGNLAECTCGIRDSLNGLVSIEGQRLVIEQGILAELKKMNQSQAHTLVLKLGTPVPQ